MAKDDIVNEFTKIKGVGKAKAELLYDKGFDCMNAWLRGNQKQAIQHNRSCLLKERDILLNRGYRLPDFLWMFSI